MQVSKQEWLDSVFQRVQRAIDEFATKPMVAEQAAKQQVILEQLRSNASHAGLLDLDVPFDKDRLLAIIGETIAYVEVERQKPEASLYDVRAQVSTIDRITAELAEFGVIDWHDQKAMQPRLESLRQA